MGWRLGVRQRRRRYRHSSGRLVVERLEARQLLCAGAGLDGGVSEAVVRPLTDRAGHDAAWVGGRVSGRWQDSTITFSFMPDGVRIDEGASRSSSLWAALGRRYRRPALWQRQIAGALQTWSVYTSLNFVVVPDRGVPFAYPGREQHDERFGDIRIGAHEMDGPGGVMAYAYLPPPNGMTGAGDVHLDSADWAGPDGPDLFTVMLHEFGHALGLPDNGADPSSVMYGVYTGPRRRLGQSDVTAIRSLYGPRLPDQYAGNVDFASAYDLGPLMDGDGRASLPEADLRRVGEADYFRFQAPSDGRIDIELSSRGLSLLDGRLLVYGPNRRLLAVADAAGYGRSERLHLEGLQAGRNYYVVARGARADVFAVGAYELSVEFTPSDRMPRIVHLGPVAFARRWVPDVGRRPMWFHLQAQRDGMLTVAARWQRAGQERGLRVYDQWLNLVAEADRRADVPARRGQQFYVEAWSGQPEASLLVTLGNLLQAGPRGQVHVFGTAGPDRILVTPGLRLTVNGLSYTLPAEEIRGMVILTGPGDDLVRVDDALTVPARVVGGPGNDRLWGGSGDDMIRGGPGADSLVGGPGADVLRGGPGNDRLQAGHGRDRLFGGPGQDWLDGGPANDLLIAGSGDDRLVGGRGRDRLSSGSGYDTLHGDTGPDAVLDNHRGPKGSGGSKFNFRRKQAYR